MSPEYWRDQGGYIEINVCVGGAQLQSRIVIADVIMDHTTSEREKECLILEGIRRAHEQVIEKILRDGWNPSSETRG